MKNLFVQRLTALCKEKNVSPQQLRHYINVKSATITKWTKGELLPNTSILKELSEYFSCSIDYLLGLTDVKDIITSDKLKTNIPDKYKSIIDKYNKLTSHDKEIVDHIFNMKQEEYPKIYHFPVFDQSAAAGVGRLDVSDAYYMKEFVVDNIPNEAVFAMKIKGVSMYNEKIGQIKDNATVLVNPKDTNYEDKIVIANLDGKIVCKRYTTVDDHVEFKSDNEFRQDENKDSRDYREPKVIGVVLGVVEGEKFVKVK